MSASVFIPMDEFESHDVDLTLSDRVARANSWAGAERQKDGSWVIALDLHEVEEASVLPRPHSDAGLMTTLMRGLVTRRQPTGTKRIRYVPRRPN
ncbi:MAG: hypothetical protein ACR2N7_01130 [Acidimicrobiia bacterium]